MYKISAVIPIYNVSEHLVRCLDSVISQSLPFFEIVLVNDGSTDNSGSIADDFAKKHDNIRVIHQANQGLSAARNAGLDVLSGEYVVFIDSDDYISSSANEKLLSILQQSDADIAIGGVCYVTEGGESYTPYPSGVQKCFSTEEALIHLNSFRYYNMSACGRIFRMSLFRGDQANRGSIRFPVGKTSEDFYIMHEIIARGKCVAYTSEPLYYYFQRQGSISRNKRIDVEPIHAANAQLLFFEENFPKLVFAARTACVFSNIGVYNRHLREKVHCPTDLLSRMRSTCRKLLTSVMMNGYIRVSKKVQAFLFCYFLWGYNAIMRYNENR